MECPDCGRYSPPCPSTGYDADDLCPACRAADAERDPDGPPDEPEMIDPVDHSTQAILMGVEALRLSAASAPTLDEALRIYRRLAQVAEMVLTAQTETGDVLDRIVERRRLYA